jgi:hypothetical protein
MNDREDLVTFSEAARIREVTPQAINDYVRRGRLKVIEEDGKRFLIRNEVQNLEKGKSGRKPAAEKNSRKEMNFDDLEESFKSRIEHPENHFPSMFSTWLTIRRILNLTPESEQLKQYKISRKNIRKFRHKFLKYERKFRTTPFLNEKIIVERVYADSKIQAFFEYILQTPEIRTEDFDLDKVFIDFLGQYFKEFSWLVDEIREPLLDQMEAARKKAGRKKGYEGLEEDTKNAYQLWIDGKSGLEVAGELFPEKKYGERKREMTKIMRNLRAFAKQYPGYFDSRHFDKEEFEQGWKKK